MRRICLTVALALAACLGYAQDEKGALTSFYEKNTVLNFNDGANIAGEIQQPTKFDPNFHIYLCFGQSNMEGNARIEPQDRENLNTRFKMMAAVDFKRTRREKGKWYVAIPPLCRENNGLTPADYFGRTMVEKRLRTSASVSSTWLLADAALTSSTRISHRLISPNQPTGFRTSAKSMITIPISASSKWLSWHRNMVSSRESSFIRDAQTMDSKTGLSA